MVSYSITVFIHFASLAQIEICFHVLYTLPKTNIAPENRPSQKERLVFQPFIFRCYISFRACVCLQYDQHQSMLLYASWKFICDSKKKRLRCMSTHVYVFLHFCYKQYSLSLISKLEKGCPSTTIASFPLKHENCQEGDLID